MDGPIMIGYFLSSTLSSYIVLMALWEVVPAASPSMRKMVQDFEMVTSGGSQTLPDWQRCIASTVGAMGFAVGALFTREHFTPNDKQEVGQSHLEIFSMKFM